MALESTPSERNLKPVSMCAHQLHHPSSSKPQVHFGAPSSSAGSQSMDQQRAAAAPRSPAPSPPQHHSDPPLSPARSALIHTPSPSGVSQAGILPASFLAHAPRVGGGPVSHSSQGDPCQAPGSQSGEDDILKADVGATRLRRFLHIFAVLAVIVLVVTGSLQICALKRVHRAYQRMEKEGWQDPRVKLMKLNSQLVEAESSVRGFVITGQESTLEVYTCSLPQVQYLYSYLKEKVTEGRLAELVRDLGPLLDKRLDYLRTTVESRRSSQDLDLQRHMLLVQMGVTSMRKLQREVEHLMGALNEHRVELQERVDVAFRTMWITSGTGLSGVILLTILGAAGAYGFNAQALKKRNEVLQRLLQEAQEATALKSNFLANISHEIRTPMNGILAMSHLLSHTPLTDEQRECNDTVLDSANSMMRLLNDLLLCSKIGAGRFMLNPAPFRIDRLLKHVHDVITSRLAVIQHGLPDQPAVVWKMWRDPKLPCTIIADSDRLQQVLLNLCENSIKFTPAPGCITLSVRLVDSHTSTADAAEAVDHHISMHGDHDHAAPEHKEEEILGPLQPSPRSMNTVTIEWSVTDTGIGIPHDVQAKIFEAFAQADMSTTKRFGGTGLGLAVCRQLVAQMQGELTVQSEEGRGSCFSFTTTMPVPEVDVDSASTDGASPMITAQPPPVQTDAAGPSSPARQHACLTASALLKPVSEEVETATGEEPAPITLPQHLELPSAPPAPPDPARQGAMGSTLAPSFAHADEDGVHQWRVGSEDWSSMPSDALSSQLRRFSNCSELGSGDWSSDGDATTTPTRAYDLQAHSSSSIASNLSPCRLTALPPALLYDTNPTCTPLPVMPPENSRTDDGVACDGVGATHRGGDGAAAANSRPDSSARLKLPPASPSVSTARSLTWPAPAADGESGRMHQSRRLTSPASTYRRSSHTSSMQSRGVSLQADGSMTGPQTQTPTTTSLASTDGLDHDHESQSESLGLAIPSLARRQSDPAPQGTSAISVVSPAGKRRQLQSPLPRDSSSSSSSSSSSAHPSAGVSLLSSSASPRFHSPARHPLNILCADDQPVNQKVLHKLLAREGHVVSMVSNGAQAVEQFKQHPSDFDLILLDVCMPVMDGPTACKLIREHERTLRAATGTPSPPITSPCQSVRLLASADHEPRLLPPAMPLQPELSRSSSPSLRRQLVRTPIIAVTASSLLEDKRACVDAGMDDVVVKPLTPSSLRAMLRPIVARKAGDKRGTMSSPATPHTPISSEPHH